VSSGWIANPVLPHDVKQHFQDLHLQQLLVKESYFPYMTITKAIMAQKPSM
jgi:hypothetical protein